MKGEIEGRLVDENGAKKRKKNSLKPLGLNTYEIKSRTSFKNLVNGGQIS